MSMCIFESYKAMLKKVEAGCVYVWKQCHDVKYKKKMKREQKEASQSMSVICVRVEDLHLE